MKDAGIKMKMKWISVKDRLPDLRVYPGMEEFDIRSTNNYLIWDEDGDYYFCLYEFNTKTNIGRWMTYRGYEYCEYAARVTHWMPLLEGPNEYTDLHPLVLLK